MDIDSNSPTGGKFHQTVIQLKARRVSSVSLPKPLIYKLFSPLTRFPSVKTFKI